MKDEGQGWSSAPDGPCFILPPSSFILITREGFHPPLFVIRDEVRTGSADRHPAPAIREAGRLVQVDGRGKARRPHDPPAEVLVLRVERHPALRLPIRRSIIKGCARSDARSAAGPLRRR